MWMGNQGMMQMAEWWQSQMEGGKSGEPGPGMPGFGAGMFPPFMPPWGMLNPDGSRSGRREGDEDRRKSRRDRSKDRSRDRRDRSESDDRDNTVDYLRLPRQIMGRVIGKQGATINGIRESSGARVDAEDKNEEMCEFKIQGTPEAVERAKAMISEVAEKSRDGAAADATVSSGTGTSETLDFPVSLMGGIIGMRGAKISEVRQQSGARIQVEKGDGRCRVAISGTPEQVERAKQLIKGLAEEESGGPISDMGRSGQSSRSEGSWGSGGGSNNAGSGAGGNAVSNTLEFPIAATGRIIGSRGAQISEVRQASGARISVEKLEESCKVQIMGTPEQVDRARKMIVALADEGQGPRRAEAGDRMEVPLSMVGRVIGKGGDTIQRLQRESGARLDVNTNEGDPCVVRISGSRDACSRARFLIAEALGWSSEVLDRGNQGVGGPGPPGSWTGGPEPAPWGPLPTFPGQPMPPFGGLPPPGDGNGNQWQAPWGPAWGYPGAGSWDAYNPTDARGGEDFAPPQMLDYSPQDPKKRKEIDLEEL